ncbi:MAG: AmmeMemoRadiSam system protein B [Ignavibacteria bacterium]|nr:AmmeMemoRadiSam system protein B [Ignavibacteria bacterium]
MDKSQVIPKLRNEIAFRIIEEGKARQILLYDLSRIASQPLILPEEFAVLFPFFDGKTTLEQFEKIVAQNYDGDVTQFMNIFVELINDLDILCYLETPYFFALKNEIDEYLNKPFRPSICAGNSYPNEKRALEKTLSNLISYSKGERKISNVKGLIVPHIDFQIGEPALRVYAEAYKSVEDKKYDAFIILGTSHYGTSDYFMFTQKDFETPLGVAINDKDFLSNVSNAIKSDITVDELAHRFEHSIEFQVILIQYVFNLPNPRIVPILVGPFNDFFYTDYFPKDDPKLGNYLKALKETIYDRYENPLIIASVDFGHIGRKFNDKFDGIMELENLRSHDRRLIEHISNCDPEAFFKEIKDTQNKFKICGLSPIYSLLSICQFEKGHFLAYDYWDDKDNSSIVSFASFCFE